MTFIPVVSSSLLDAHLDAVAAFYDAAPEEITRAGVAYRHSLAHHYRNMVPPDASVLEVGCGAGHLLALLPNRDVTGVDVSARQLERARERVPHGAFVHAAGENLRLDRTFDVIIVSDSLNEAGDVQLLLERLHHVCHSGTRLLLNFHNNAWLPVFRVATRLGIKSSQPFMNWLSSGDVANLLELSGWQMIRVENRILSPFRLGGLGAAMNRWLAPLAGPLCMCLFMVARPPCPPRSIPPSVSVVVPARNEAGNIEAAVTRTPDMGSATQLIFIEGGSSDDTWREIERVRTAYPGKDILALRQSGKGKGNAVREAFAQAKGDMLMVLDADLTMPPEELPKYYQALASGGHEFANGVRLVYPMEKRAMRFLNMCANKAFGVLFSFVLGQRVKDTLCGTKVLWKSDYEHIAKGRSHFGELDPYGDFDLLFGAAKLNLKIIDIPIRYRERTYGETNINRWSGGVLLTRMLVKGALRLKFL